MNASNLLPQIEPGSTLTTTTTTTTILEEKKKEICKDGNVYNFACPHCGLMIQVEENAINCKIFRHGNYVRNRQPIPPHSSQTICESLVSSKQITGCGKPFIFDGNHLTICGYI